MSRAEAEELLAHSANDQGAFLVRFSSKHKRLVVSVKTYEETHQEYRYRWGHRRYVMSFHVMSCDMYYVPL